MLQYGLRKAWGRRNRLRELRTRGATGPIEIEIKYRESPKSTPITYHLSLDENERGPVVTAEWLQWRRSQTGKPFQFLDFQHGAGQVISGDTPDQGGERIQESLAGPDVLAVNALGQLNKHPRVVALRAFITGWYLSYLAVDSTRHTAEGGPQERLSEKGDNLANVVQYLAEQHPQRLTAIENALAQRVPRLRSVGAAPMPDGRLLLTVRDAPFEQPILAKFASDGTLKMLAYLTLLYDPAPPPQLMISSHSPFLVNALRPAQVWILYRDANGYTQATRADHLAGVQEFVEASALLGDLWMEGHFGVGNPAQPDAQPRLRPATAAAAVV